MNEWEHFLNERLEWMIKIITNEGTEWDNKITHEQEKLI
jgi:hypothetical protein